MNGELSQRRQTVGTSTWDGHGREECLLRTGNARHALVEGDEVAAAHQAGAGRDVQARGAVVVCIGCGYR